MAGGEQEFLMDVAMGYEPADLVISGGCYRQYPYWEIVARWNRN